MIRRLINLDADGQETYKSGTKDLEFWSDQMRPHDDQMLDD